MFRSLDYLALAAVGALVVGAVIVWKRGGLSLQSFNPAAPGNVVDNAANRVVQVMTGDPNQTVGGVVYDTWNPGAGLGPGEVSPWPGVIAPASELPARGMGDDNAWWYGESALAENAGGAVTGRVMRP